MTCQQVQNNLTLYLYGELEFAQEETIEEHLSGCVFCQMALAREKSWHASLHAEAASTPRNLLEECRQELRNSVTRSGTHISTGGNRTAFSSWSRWMDIFSSAMVAWPARVAASFLLLVTGFGAGRWVEKHQPVNAQSSFAPPMEMGLFQPYTHVRDIRPEQSGRIRIVVDEGRERELSGPVSDDRLRQLLITATQDPGDPAVRIYSVEMLSGQTGDDVRDALLTSARHDPNAAVRMKAIEGLRAFPADQTTRLTLIDVLKTDANAGVRSEAINVLSPSLRLGPDLSSETVEALKEIAQSDDNDDYIRLRCLQILHGTGDLSPTY